MDNALQQGLIPTEILGVSFAPATDYNDTSECMKHDVREGYPTRLMHVSSDGALTFGGVDESLYEGSITYTPVTATYPASYYWGINVTGATYGEETVIPGSYAGIVDTGTTREYDGAETRP